MLIDLFENINIKNGVANIEITYIEDREKKLSFTFPLIALVSGATIIAGGTAAITTKPFHNSSGKKRPSRRIIDDKKPKFSKNEIRKFFPSFLKSNWLIFTLVKESIMAIINATVEISLVYLGKPPVTNPSIIPTKMKKVRLENAAFTFDVLMVLDGINYII